MGINQQYAGQRHALTRSRRSRAATVASLAAVLLLAGCSEEAPEPAPLESPAAAASTETARSEPTPAADAAPELPPEARGTSKASAVAFVKHWIQTFNHSVTHGDALALARLAKGCAACKAISQLIEDVESKQGHIETAGWTIRTIEALDTAPTTQVRALVDSAEQAFKVPGEATKRFPGGPSVKTFTLARTQRGWRVTYLDQS